MQLMNDITGTKFVFYVVNVEHSEYFSVYSYFTKKQQGIIKIFVHSEKIVLSFGNSITT